MAGRLDYFFKQKLSEAELDEGFDKMEQAIKDTMADQLLIGIWSGAVVSQHSPTADLTIDITGPAIGRDKNGDRLFFSPLQVKNIAVDENGVTTSVGTAGNEKKISVFWAFDRALSDPRTDGNANTVFFQRAESFKLNVVQSAEALIGAAVLPPLRVDQILICDITLINGQTQILNADIGTTRREDTFDLTGSPNSIKTGRVESALQSMLNIINGGAVNISYAGGGTWADTTTNPSATVEAQLDKIISDLATGAGTAKLLGSVSVNPNPILTAVNLAAQLTELETQIVDGLNKHGSISRSRPLDNAISTGGLWTLVTGIDTLTSWTFNGAFTGDQLQITLPLAVGDVLETAFATLFTAGATETFDLELVRYDFNPATGVTSRVLLGTSAGVGTSGGLSATFSVIPGATETMNSSSDVYRLEITPSGAGVGNRSVLNASYKTNRKTA